MITNNKSSEEVIALLEGDETKVFAFYKYQFTQEIIQKMKLVALTSRKIVWSLSECQNFSKENIYEIFVQLSKNQILEKFHFNFLSNNDLESKDYSKLYSYLQDNPKLKSLNCPHYGIMLQGTLDLFHKNQNINRLQVSILDMVYYKLNQKEFQCAKVQTNVVEHKPNQLISKFVQSDKQPFLQNTKDKKSEIFIEIK